MEATKYLLKNIVSSEMAMDGYARVECKPKSIGWTFSIFHVVINLHKVYSIKPVFDDCFALDSL